MARTTYERLQRQIAALQAQAEKLRRREVDEVIGRIREAIAFYGITAADLGLAGAEASPPGRRGRPAKAGKPLVRYRDENGNTWAGRGKRPQWLRDALEAGRTLDEFRVDRA
ncbi:MAG TPA: H-NS histone family protein [Rubrivivax sp.]|nr:H-NS histone family protein [Burkholderiales bacterium]HNT40052.1 H-NS histone family protein [Rubrivivax sp.]